MKKATKKKVTKKATKPIYRGMVYHIVVKSKAAEQELDALLSGKRSMYCDFVQSLSSYKMMDYL